MSRSVAVLCLLTAVDMIGFGIVIPLLPYFGQHLGAGPFEITVIIASFPAAQLLMSAVWGRMSDRRGRKPILVAGLCASAVSYGVFANATSLTILLASRILAGSAGATVGVAQAYIADLTDARDRARGIGYLGAAYGVGVVVGPLIGVAAVQQGYGAVGWTAAAICAANALAAHLFLPESRVANQDRTLPAIGTVIRRFMQPPLRRVAVLYFLILSAYDGTMAIYALLYQQTLEFGARDIALLWGWAALVQILARAGLIGFATRVLDEADVVALGGLLMFVGLGAAPFASSWSLAFLATTVGVVGSSLCLPTISSIISKTGDARSLGALMGSAQIIAGSARVAGPMVLGLVFQLLGGPWAFLVAALAGLFGGGLARTRVVRALTVSVVEPTGVGQ